MQFCGNRFFYAALFAAVLLIQFIWIRMKNKSGREFFSDRLTDVVFCLFLAITIGTLFRLYPGNHLSPEWDSAVFLYIGRRMTEGKIPYLDLFDHKGPLLYLIEYLGCLLTPGRFAGVWFFEIVSLFVTLYLSCRAARILTKEDNQIYISLLLTYFLVRLICLKQELYYIWREKLQH